jgi:hypothetical protein
MGPSGVSNPIDPRVSGHIFRGGRQYFPRTVEIPWRLEQSGLYFPPSPRAHSEVRTLHTGSLYPTRSVKL